MMSILLLGTLANIPFTYCSSSTNSRTDRIVKKGSLLSLVTGLIFLFKNPMNNYEAIET